ncbi:MAG: nitrogen regulation protein NR(I) [Pseudomonadota bacterium]
MSADTVWVVDDDRSIRWVLSRALEKADISVRTFEHGEEVIDQLDASPALPDAIITDVRMPGMDGISFMRTVQGMHSNLPVIVMTAHSDLDSAVNAYEGGAFDYLPKPFDIDAAVELAQRAAAHSRSSRHTAVADDETPDTLTDIIGAASAMQDVFRAIGRLSRSNITVLINGESGTGKELIARALHRHSPRAASPFIALNMAAIPRELMESELFGHERGAFTGAQTQRIGRFEQANGGTLFLDEIGDMPSDLQTRLLRVLSDGEFFRVGGARPLQADVRIVAATHQDLETRVANGEFREDLFHRLNVIRLRVPPLRERREDIPLLLEHFLTYSATELGVSRKQPTQEVLEYLSRLAWPGNVRQLENTAHWLTVMASGRELHVSDLPDTLRNPDTDDSATAGDWTSLLRQWADGALSSGQTGLMTDATKSLERTLIGAALTATGGRRQDAARLLGWGRNTLTRKISELDL